MGKLKDGLARRSAEKQSYMLETLPSGLAERNKGQRLHELLTDFDFIEAKLELLGVQALIEDYDLARNSDVLLSEEQSQSLRLIQGAIRKSAHVLEKEKTQLAVHLWSRLVDFETPEIQEVVKQAKQSRNSFCLWPLKPNLERANEGALRTLVGHTSFVLAVAIAPDGKTAISASWDETLKIWDTETGRELKTLTGHSNSVWAVAIAPNGKTAISASRDKTLKIWDTETGRELKTLTGHSEWVRAVAIAPDGKTAISASSDNTLKIWDTETGRELKTLTGHSNSVWAVAIAPDGKTAISASEDHTLKIWDTETGSELKSLTGHSFWVYAVAIAPDGKTAISASMDNTLKIWDTETGQELKTLTGHSFWVYAVAIAPDGKTAISASWDETLKIWDTETGRELKTLIGDSEPVTAVAIAPDDKTAISASWDNTLKIWDTEPGRELKTLTGHSESVTAVAIAPDGKTAISASEDRTLKVWDLLTGKEVASFSGEGAFSGCAFAPDGVTVVAGDASGRVHFLRLEGMGDLGDAAGLNNPVSLFYSGLALAKQGQYEAALVKLTEVAEMRQDALIVCLLERGKILCELERYAEAVASLDQAKEIAGKDRDFWFCLGFAHMKCGNQEAARESWDFAINIQPNDYDFWSEKAKALLWDLER